MSKAALKAIGELIRQSKWGDAIEQARQFVQKEPKSFQGYIFLAFALDKNQKLEESEESYLAAAALKPDDPQPWQGLVKLYQKQGGNKIAAYKVAALELAQRYRDVNDMYKCQCAIDDFTKHAQAQGEASYVEALEVILPDSPIYPALEGRLPHPARTYETIARFIETDEKKRINTLIGERRTRIGARVSEVTIEVKREVWGRSRLGHIYREIINWTNDDELRRVYEEKLLQHCYDRLLVFAPGPDKAAELGVVQKLAQDMVIIKHPFKLAWDITIDWQDHKEIRQWDVTILRDYCTFFPDSDLYKIITGFLTSAISPFPKQEKSKTPQKDAEASDDESEDDEDGGAPTAFIPITDEDRILMMTEGITSADSLFAYRLMGEFYQHLEEYDSNVDLMRKSREHLISERRKTGLKFQNTENSFLICLGTALVFFQSPRHHQEAKALFDSVLERDPTATPALIGVGLIFEEEEEFDDAIDFLERALTRDPSNLRVRTEAAWVKAQKGDYSSCRGELEKCIPLLEEGGQPMKSLLAQTQYRLGVCIWNIDTSKAARKSRSGAYAQFLACLKNDLNFAPAYTSLGMYYEECSKDKNRARKCFLKAVELSPSEVDAAERLARSLADERDWDGVELVSQRVVDSGKVRPPPGSKRKGLSWPFAALGVAELNKQDYAKAVVSFQSALRISPDDYHSWVGLGESYYNSGRYIAATKATLNAQQFESTSSGPQDADDVWFTKFLLANIKRQLSSYDEAISLYKEVIEKRPDEDGVSIALMQTMVESALSSIDKGLFGKAVDLAINTITFATTASSNISETFNFWKAVADSCSVFSSVQGRVGDFPVDLVRTLIGEDDEAPHYETFKDVDGVGVRVIQAKGLFSDDEKLGVHLTQCLQANILAHKRAIHASANDVHAQAVAYFNLGWAEYRAHSCLPVSLRTKSSRYLKAAVRAFKRAIELEAGNSEFWEALGVVTSSINPSVAQHAFVRSLYLNERSPSAWANLGTLALLQNDFQLANEAFTKSQSADPDYAHAWVGQGFVALLYGDPREARGLFTHAMGIAGIASAPVRQQYAMSMFDHIVAASPHDTTPIGAILQPIFALSQLRALKPQHELAVGHLLTLFHERVGHHSEGVAVLEPMCAALEADYETTESAESLRKFALAKADLARAYLADGSYEKAVESGEMALQLSSEGDESELRPEERNKARLSAHLALGLAQYYNDAVDEAVQYFESALEESGGDADAICLLAQVLWAVGTEEAQDRARTSLFEVVEKQPDHVRSVLLLGAIALLDDDDESLEAVVAELQGLRASDKVGAVEQSHISDILQAVAALSAEGADKVKGQAQTDIMLHPYLPHGWLNLSSVVDSGGGVSANAAEVAVELARRAVAPRGNLEAGDLARTYAGATNAANAQTAIGVAPWVKDGSGEVRSAARRRALAVAVREGSGGSGLGRVDRRLESQV
ncbi:hypothetical protein PspLS_00934 [Pyricularia sp. CBS 133598]|nr:hypothetical protein PspLS_00934 [Pyricularia sp. CBS 133598]